MRVAGRWTGAVVLVVGIVVGGAPAFAQSTPGRKCASGKMKAGGKHASGELGCHAKAVAKGQPVDPTCLAKADGKLVTAYGKLEARGGCITTMDAAAIAVRVDTFAGDVVGALPDPGTADGRKCASAKRKAAGKKAAGKLGCHAKAVAKGAAVDPACLAKAEAKFVAAFAKAEARGGCATSGDAAAIEALVDALVTDVVAALPSVATVSFAADVQPILTANCALVGCHSGAFPQAFLNLEAGQAYASLVNVASVECPAFMRVLPGDPDASYVVFKLQGFGPCFSGVQMPFGAPPLPPAQIQLVRDWVMQGAANN
jgi:hypothetical protein